MPHAYSVHGLNVVSDVELLGLRPAASGADGADVRIRLGAAPASLPDGRWCDDGYAVRGEEALLHVPSVGRYWARRGADVTVAPDAPADDEQIATYLLGSGLAAILHQRGLFPLHASAFERGGTCIGFLGDSGCGKSTLAAMLLRRGFRLVSDDVLVTRVDAGGAVLASPGVPIVKLYDAAAEAAGMTGSQWAKLPRAAAPKQRIDARATYVREPVRLKRLYVLRWLEPATATPELAPLSAFRSVVALRQHVYRESLVEAMDREASFFSFAARLLAEVEVFEFRRAADLSRAHQQVDALLAHIEAGVARDEGSA